MKNYKTAKLKNEFDEIKVLRAKHEPPINKEDITDFQIDFGLYNKKLEESLKKTDKEPKEKQGKKTCVKARSRTRKCKKISVKKSSNISGTIKKSLNLITSNSKLSMQEEAM